MIEIQSGSRGAAESVRRIKEEQLELGIMRFKFIFSQLISLGKSSKWSETSNVA